MTFVTDQTSQELRAHMRRLKALPGWNDPLSDRLFKEVQEQDDELHYLRWFCINADFGPSDEDVRQHLRQSYEKETGKPVPVGWRGSE